MVLLLIVQLFIPHQMIRGQSMMTHILNGAHHQLTVGNYVVMVKEYVKIGQVSIMQVVQVLVK
jgi:hypothetical protein